MYGFNLSDELSILTQSVEDLKHVLENERTIKNFEIFSRLNRMTEHLSFLLKLAVAMEELAGVQEKRITDMQEQIEKLNNLNNTQAMMLLNKP